MATKPRRIQVDSCAFLWKVDPINATTVRLRIWVEGTKSKPWAEVFCRLDDQWVNFKEIASTNPEERKSRFELRPLMPGLVAEIIRKASMQIEANTDPSHHSCFELLANGSLAQKAKMRSNPSIELARPGKPGHTAHVKR